MKFPIKFALVALPILPLVFCDDRSLCLAQDQESASASLNPRTVVVLDQPAVIPPEMVVPEALAKSISLDLNQSSIQELADQLGQQLGITVLLDQGPLKQANILPGDIVSFSCEKQSAYIVLQRLAELRLGWILDGNLLLLSSIPESQSRYFTATIPVGDLRDQGYSPQTLVQLCEESLGADWKDATSVMCLGDILFVRHNLLVQLQARALIKSLQNPSRKSLVLVSQRHSELLEALKQPIDINFQQAPLDEALKEISEKIGQPISIDVGSLDEEKIRIRQPVTLQLGQRPADTTMRYLLDTVGLDYYLIHGQILVTTKIEAKLHRTTATFDVRDLCTSFGETERLVEAVSQQTDVAKILVAKSGVIVVRDTEPSLDAISSLLENYRLAMRQSKPRETAELDPDEIIVLYYRMPTAMAESVQDVLPELVGTETWKKAGTANSEDELPAAGSVQRLLSKPEIEYDLEDSPAMTVPYSVLVISHRRAVHEIIAQRLRSVADGDSQWEGAASSGLGGGGMGGGGGGLFNLGK